MGEEVIQCEPYLHDQINHIKPEIIVAMGRFAAQALLKSTSSIAELRGQGHEYSELKIPLVVTYHPAYLLRSLLEKQKVWKDLQFAQSLFSGSKNERSI
jgi:DNA polymerase|tara:strand:- start:459 stop:755 length:297 start_codon:yes stop_codon:yes gene_type:complete